MDGETRERLPLPEQLAATLDRGFTRYYCLNSGGKPDHDLYVHRHVNGLLMVGLAPSHPLRREDAQRIVEVKFTPAVSSGNVSGKRKKGAAAVKPRTKVADLRLADGTASEVHAGVEAKVLELNERLRAEPGLLQSDPDDAGFIAILQPWPNQGEYGAVSELADEERFLKRRKLLVVQPQPVLAPAAPTAGEAEANASKPQTAGSGAQPQPALAHTPSAAREAGANRSGPQPTGGDGAQPQPALAHTPPAAGEADENASGPQPTGTDAGTAIVADG